MLHIVMDGAGDLPAEWQRTYAIHLLPLRVHFGNDTYTQGENITHADFYRMVAEQRVIPKTSLPSIGQVAAFYRKIANPGDSVLSIHVSSKLSGTFATVQAAAKELAGEINVYPFDSLAGSLAQGFLAREARLLETSGASMQQILDRLHGMRDNIAILFTLDSLQYAYFSGRVGAIQNLMASALQIKPIIMVREGTLEVTEKVRTRRRALEHSLRTLQERMSGRIAALGIAHAADPNTAAWLVEEARKVLNLREVWVTDLSIPIAANLGPGAIGCVIYPLPAREE